MARGMARGKVVSNRNDVSDVLDRRAELTKVFRAFDMDGSGSMEPNELLVLGQRRQELGQKKRMWTAEKNAAMVAKMDKDGDGEIDEGEFVEWYVGALASQDDSSFVQTMQDFIACVPGRGESGSATARSSSGTKQKQQIDSVSRRSTSVIGGSPSGFKQRVDREKELAKVFRAFDLDGSGICEADELLVLGQRRQELGQKQRAWTEQKNAALIKKMDQNGDGQIEESEFVRHFVMALQAEGDATFLQTVKNFKACVPKD